MGRLLTSIYFTPAQNVGTTISTPRPNHIMSSSRMGNRKYIVPSLGGVGGKAGWGDL